MTARMARWSPAPRDRRCSPAPAHGRVLGLRPEDVTVDTASGRGRFHVTVTAVEYLGAEALVTCAIGERSILARTRGGGAPPVGATVGLVWDTSAGHVFDAASGQRLALESGAGSRLPDHHISAHQGSTCA